MPAGGGEVGTQDAASESLPKHRETSTFVVVQPQPPTAQLRLECPVLFAEECDHIGPLALASAKEDHEQHVGNHTPKST